MKKGRFLVLLALLLGRPIAVVAAPFGLPLPFLGVEGNFKSFNSTYDEDAWRSTLTVIKVSLPGVGRTAGDH